MLTTWMGPLQWEGGGDVRGACWPWRPGPPPADCGMASRPRDALGCLQGQHLGEPVNVPLQCHPETPGPRVGWGRQTRIRASFLPAPALCWTPGEPRPPCRPHGGPSLGTGAGQRLGRGLQDSAGWWGPPTGERAAGGADKMGCLEEAPWGWSRRGASAQGGRPDTQGGLCRARVWGGPVLHSGRVCTRDVNGPATVSPAEGRRWVTSPPGRPGSVRSRTE